MTRNRRPGARWRVKAVEWLGRGSPTGCPWGTSHDIGTDAAGDDEPGIVTHHNLAGTDFDKLVVGGPGHTWLHVEQMGERAWWLNVGNVVAATNDGPLYQRLSQRMMHPEVGDLVVETSSLRGYDPDGVGHLRAVEGDDPQYPDIYVVEPLHRPGEQVRWGNATFLAVPTERAERWLAEDDDPDCE